MKVKGNRVPCPLCGCESLSQAGLPGHVAGARCARAVALEQAIAVAIRAGRERRGAA